MFQCEDETHKHINHYYAPVCVNSTSAHVCLLHRWMETRCDKILRAIAGLHEKSKQKQDSLKSGLNFIEGFETCLDYHP